MQGVLLSLLLGLLCSASAALADERVQVCYNYGCLVEAEARFSEAQLGTVRRQLQAASSPGLERQILARVMGKLYYWAGQQTPIYADRGGNTADDAVNGAMDCIDHSTTTTRLLKMLQRRGWLRYHRVLEPAQRTRFFIFDHFSAVIEEQPPPWLPGPRIESHPEAPEGARHERFVVDSWFVDNGRPAVILPLDDWMDGGGPDVEPD